MAFADIPGVGRIKREHIIRAIGRIDGEGVPPEHRSREWELKYEDRSYPPKYVVKLAYEYANPGVTISTEEYNVHEALAFLIGLGFEVRRI